MKDKAVAVSGTRKHYIDNLRWADVLLLIPYQAALAWNCWGEPDYVTFGESRAVSSIIVFFSPYFMPLMFLLAGISTSFALKKRSCKEYLKERALRLLVPLVFGTFVLMPPLSYIGDKFNRGYEGSFFSHYKIFFTRFTDLVGADGGFSFGQFWFLLYLFVISCIAAGVWAVLKKRGTSEVKALPFPVVLLLGLPLPLLAEVLSIGGKSLAEYTYIFLLGQYVFSKDEVMQKAEKYCPFTLMTGILAAVADVYLFLWTEGSFTLINTIAKFAAEWLMVAGLMGAGKRWFDKSSSFTAVMSKFSFPFFSLHFLWTVLFQYLMADTFRKSTALMYLIPVISAYAATFACCAIVLKIPPLCFLMGVKYQKKRA